MMTRTTALFIALLACLLSLALVACEDKKEDTPEKTEGASKSSALATTSPTVCDHIKEVGDAAAYDEQRCIMRLDALQMHVGKEDWTAVHAKCLLDATDQAAVDACLAAADQAAADKAKAQ